MQVEEEIESQITNAEMRVAALHNVSSSMMGQLYIIVKIYKLKTSFFPLLD